jgi:predicted RNase H-like nuclease (RuvC/YqgF family)
MPDQETEIQKLKETIRSQEEIIQTLKKQLAELKAVDLELVQPEPAVEAP